MTLQFVSYRTAGVGLCSMFGRLGGILAPLILAFGKHWAPLPLLVFGCVSIFAGFLALLLPETLGKKLPETMEEGEELGSKFCMVCYQTVLNCCYTCPRV